MMTITRFRTGHPENSSESRWNCIRTHFVTARIGDVVLTRCGLRFSHRDETMTGGGTVYPGDLGDEVTCENCFKSQFKGTSK